MAFSESSVDTTATSTNSESQPLLPLPYSNDSMDRSARNRRKVSLKFWKKNKKQKVGLNDSFILSQEDITAFDEGKPKNNDKKKKSKKSMKQKFDRFCENWSASNDTGNTNAMPYASSHVAFVGGY